MWARLSICIFVLVVLSSLLCAVKVAGENSGSSNNTSDSFDCFHSVKPVQTVPAFELYRLGRDVVADSGRREPGLPCWFDPNLARVGQRFARRNFAQLVIGHFLSLFLLIANPDIRRILYFTMKSDDPEKAYKRYIATALHVKLWYDVDILQANLSTSVRKVRNIHRATAYRVQDENLDFTRPLVQPWNHTGGFQPKKEMWEAFQRDVEEGLPLLGLKPAQLIRDKPEHFFNQYLMSVTQWSFMALPILHTNPLAFVFVDEQDLMGFTHLWAGLAWMLGMDEKYILCKEPNLLECYRYTRMMEREYFLPFLYHIDYEAQIMLESLLRAVEKIVPQATSEMFLLQLLEDIVGIPCPNLRRYSSWSTRALRFFQRFFAEPLFHWPGLQWLGNLFVRGQIQVSSLRLFGFDGTNSSTVAEEGYFFKRK